MLREFWLFGLKQAYACLFGGFLLGWLLVALFIWIAENIATYANIWIYPNQSVEWNMVPLAKLSSWYMLMLLSFVLITLINQVRIREIEDKALPGSPRNQ